MKRIFLVLIFLFFIQVVLAAPPSIGTVNVTNPIDLNGGSTETVYCNATVSDSDGWENITTVNSTIWHSSSSEGAIDDENDHYTDSSCALGTNISLIELPAVCSFDLQYYSNPDTWTCKIRAYDESSEGNNQTTTTVNELLAISIPDIINFGQMSLGEISTNETENVTTVENTGNIPIDVKLSGDDMSCSSGSIPVSNIKYSSVDNTSYSLMTALTGTPTTLDLNITQRTNGISTKDVFWKIKIPDVGVGGSCSDTITFTAVAD